MVVGLGIWRRVIAVPWHRKRKALVLAATPEATGFRYLGSGAQESLIAPDRRFAERLRRRGFAFVFQEQRGGHDWGEWNRQIPDCFARWKAIAAQGATVAGLH